MRKFLKALVWIGFVLWMYLLFYLPSQYYIAQHKAYTRTEALANSIPTGLLAAFIFGVGWKIKSVLFNKIEEKYGSTKKRKKTYKYTFSDYKIKHYQSGKDEISDKVISYFDSVTCEKTSEKLCKNAFLSALQTKPLEMNDLAYLELSFFYIYATGSYVLSDESSLYDEYMTLSKKAFVDISNKVFGVSGYSSDMIDNRKALYDKILSDSFNAAVNSAANNSYLYPFEKAALIGKSNTPDNLLKHVTYLIYKDISNKCYAAFDEIESHKILYVETEQKETLSVIEKSYNTMSDKAMSILRLYEKEQNKRTDNSAPSADKLPVNETVEKDDIYYIEKALEMGVSVETARRFDEQERELERRRAEEAHTVEKQKTAKAKSTYVPWTEKIKQAPRTVIFAFSVYVVMSIMYFVACMDLGYGYYTFIRILSLIALISAVIAYCNYAESILNPITIGTVPVIILFNPILPIYMDEETWIVFDVICAALMLAAAVYISEVFFLKNRDILQRRTQKGSKWLLVINAVIYAATSVLAFVSAYLTYDDGRSWAVYERGIGISSMIIAVAVAVGLFFFSKYYLSFLNALTYISIPVCLGSAIMSFFTFELSKREYYNIRDTITVLLATIGVILTVATIAMIIIICKHIAEEKMSNKYDLL